jgi:hypothetical protein
MINFKIPNVSSLTNKINLAIQTYEPLLSYCLNLSNKKHQNSRSISLRLFEHLKQYKQSTYSIQLIPKIKILHKLREISNQ